MVRIILIYILIIAISILVGLSIRLNHTKSSLYRGTDITNIEDASLVKECDGGICSILIGG
ncbi:MAG: hypothetical protein KAW56_11800 [Candidatus Marinimicrobia bacterium]|nr:hypothetical protein [Candidatus Neomarinimicrobiota bacterium]